MGYFDHCKLPRSKMKVLCIIALLLCALLLALAQADASPELAPNVRGDDDDQHHALDVQQTSGDLTSSEDSKTQDNEAENDRKASDEDQDGEDDPDEPEEDENPDDPDDNNGGDEVHKFNNDDDDNGPDAPYEEGMIEFLLSLFFPIAITLGSTAWCLQSTPKYQGYPPRKEEAWETGFYEIMLKKAEERKIEEERLKEEARLAEEERLRLEKEKEEKKAMKKQKSFGIF